MGRSAISAFCIMGMNGEIAALAVYPGPEGLKSLREIGTTEEQDMPKQRSRSCFSDRPA
jgi:hypothetical protein